MIHDNFCSPNYAASFPTRVIETLGRLQVQSNHPISSSTYIYDLVEQRTICSSCSVATLLGYSADDVLAMWPIGLASLIHPDDINRVADHYQRFTTLVSGEVITIEYRMKRSNGKWCWLRSQETPLVQAIDGFPLQILGLLEDITPLPSPNPRKSMLLSRYFRQPGTKRRRRIAATHPKQSHLSQLTQ